MPSPTKGFGYYETIAGGSGAGPTWSGTSGVHTHMTNTRITDAEVFERRYPVLLREFSLRSGSGGLGQHRGGDGVIRDIEFRIPVQVSILSERRVFHPYGLEGGGEASCGKNLWVRKILAESSSRATAGGGGGGDGSDGSGKTKEGKEKLEERIINLGGKNTAEMAAGERIIIMTPGGGGWGAPSSSSSSSSQQEGVVGVNKKESTIPAVRKRDAKEGWRTGTLALRTEMQETSF